jgi:hypothetical protein
MDFIHLSNNAVQWHSENSKILSRSMEEGRGAPSRQGGSGNNSFFLKKDGVSWNYINDPQTINQSITEKFTFPLWV